MMGSNSSLGSQCIAHLAIHPPFLVQLIIRYPVPYFSPSFHLNLTLYSTLKVLQACANNCGPTFHNEIGKFKFLNEMIKLVSPKYLGNHTHPAVKERVVELLFSWTLDLKGETKILEAYNMLKKQGVVKVSERELLSFITSVSFLGGSLISAFTSSNTMREIGCSINQVKGIINSRAKDINHFIEKAVTSKSERE